jgi:hypothetical protein
VLLALGGLSLTAAVQAEPYLAVANGFKCGQCHVNPSGGGERTVFGEVFAQTLMPAQHLDTGTDVWSGQINRFIALGGDLRFQGAVQQVPHTATTDEFDLEQARIYLSANVIPERLLVYLDEQVAPGGALNREAWGMFWSADHAWYVKAGQMYLPFGLRLQDQSAFILTASGINMTTPDKGVELGWEKGHWDVQLALSNGTAGGSTTGNGKQTSAQAAYVERLWRLGVAANLNDSDPSGSRTAYALFGGLKTGPVGWLGQVEVIDDRSITPGGQKQLAGLIEANYGFRRGHNIKLTAEYLDPNREVPNDAQTRWSLLYEYTPVQFLQLRGGVRYGDGIPQVDAQHLKLYFVELHGFF